MVSKTSSKFSYEIVSRNLLGLPSDQELVNVDGKDAVLKKNQFVLQLKDTSRVDSYLKRHGLHLIEQEKIFTDIPVLTGDRDHFTQSISKNVKMMPVYLVDFTPGIDDDISDLSDRARRLNITNQVKFYSKSDAVAFDKMLEIREDDDNGNVTSCANYIAEPQFNESEGTPPNSSTHAVTPTSSDFWWTGGSWDAGHSTSGANLNKTSDHASWDYWSGQGVKVAVVDAGFFDYSEGGMPYGVIRNGYYSYNGINGTTGPSNIAGAGTNLIGLASNEPWHGRWVCSAIFAPNNDSAGTVGTGNGAIPMLMKTDYTPFRNGACISQAEAWGAKVINMSYGFTNIVFGSSPDASAIKTAALDGLICLAAGGNGGIDNNFYPAAYSGYVIGVGCYDQYATLASYSNYASFISIYAPGETISVAQEPPNAVSTYRNISGGTSLATAVVSGIIASCVESGQVYNYATALNRLTSSAHYFVYNPNNPGTRLPALDGLHAVRGYSYKTL